MLKVEKGEAVNRQDILDGAVATIPDIAKRKASAQSSWATRFIKRNKLSDCMPTYPKRPKPNPTTTSTLPEKSMYEIIFLVHDDHEESAVESSFGVE
ncbi:hypothetical protein P3T76_007948 [Phytophthora citrophthora]|uniref:Uncharacterized protein n=1 Tax=Phytophthora citrophthora TaxID=4793 RepID=A0AAD9GL82_9STRA|nr:hypothetical protein P3T76_007948 [Phytophthora citrophthora]